ncbi:DUF4123 domain-containing protein [Xanthomonas graminis]|nr:DUF4123 domain-containing protein [Xanthomonas translucens]UKE72941.1 DUF4123 domain-containing protein [Xanthomonas translucens pv. phleipratensis]
MHRYVIVDCAVRHDAAKTLRFYAEQLPHRALFQGQPEAKHAHAGPWLVQVDHSNALHGWLNALDGTCAPCVTHLAASDGFEAVFTHLQSLLHMKLSDGSSALLRFYDPRVMGQLQKVLTEEQFCSIIAPFTEWRTRQGRYSNAQH